MSIPVIKWDGKGIQIDDELMKRQVAPQEQRQNKKPTSSKKR